MAGAAALEHTAPVNALTIDLEEYFHAENLAAAYPRERWDQLELRSPDLVLRLLDTLDEAGVKATFFILGWWAERRPKVVEAVAERGHEVACHGEEHRLVWRQGRDAFAADVSRAVERLRAISGQPVDGYRAPCFSITADCLWALDVLIDLGFRYDASIYPLVRERCGIAGAPDQPYRIRRPDGRSILEAPPPSIAIAGRRFPIAGGGYFRLLPYVLTRAALRRVNRQGGMLCVYLHPWEFDPEPPLPRVRWSYRFRHSINIRKTDRRLRRLLADLPFAPLATCLDRLAIDERDPARDVTFAEAAS